MKLLDFLCKEICSTLTTVNAQTNFFFLTRFGRRPLLLVSYLLSMLFGVISAFSTSYIMFAVLRFLTGLSLAGLSIISVVLSK